MKSIFCIISFILVSGILYSQRGPLTPLMTGEIQIAAKNNPNSVKVTVTLSCLASTRWDEDGFLTYEYGSDQQDSLKNNHMIFIDLITSTGTGSMVMALGVYRISVAAGAYFDIDTRTSSVIIGHGSGCPDLYFEYDVQNNKFTWQSRSTSINGESMALWENGHNDIPYSSADLEPYPPTSLSIDGKTEDYPILSWAHNTTGGDYRTGYRIYRCITEHNFDTPMDFVPIATVAASCTTYSDTQVEYGNWNCAHYKVKSVNGDIESLYSNEADAQLIKLLKDGKKDTTKVANNIPRKIFQAYPNPFNPVTKIYYSVNSNNSIILQIFDILGNKVSELVNEIKPIGEYTTLFDGSHVPSGMYICRFQCGNYIDSKKILLLK